MTALSIYAKAVELYEPPKILASSDIYLNLLNIGELICNLVVNTKSQMEAEPGPFSMAHPEDVKEIRENNERLKSRLNTYEEIAYWLVWVTRKNHPDFNKEQFYKECGL